ncbi:MAG: phosphoadenosine phosphosulfate reductase [Dictyoglomus sp. NZ13-RE01]|nr:MAG: phosphoadenosine phosphosulfate reductase [Dictyoglomus sp. NZ13-RE01]
MYKVEWDKKSGGVLLVTSSENEIIPPRPVFYEELDLLGFNKYWDYPQSQEPLLWNIGRRYFYKGELVAEVRGGNIYEEPKIKLTENGKNLKLEPINLELLIENNKEALKTIENEAIDFINEVYNKYKDKVDYFIVSYSGGKDSQVVLDLVSRTIPPDEFMVIFTDTTMEIPPTYEIFEKTKEYYSKIYPTLKFFIVRNEQHSYDLWKIFGPPSRIIRWCCSVYKTSPQVRFLRRLNPEKQNLKILVFDGVRAEESTRRSGYSRVAEEVKHLTQINAEVIRDWNLTETFIYIYSRSLPLNKGYRYGLNRVGCSICPFGSSWSEYIIRSIFPDIANVYIDIIGNHLTSLGLHDEEERKKYIISGNWKKRAGGDGVENNIRVEFIKENKNFKIIMFNPRENILEWLKVFKIINIRKNQNTYIGELKFNDFITDIKLYLSDNYTEIIVENDDVNIINTIKKIAYKTAYCIHCGACEAECKTGALKVLPNVKINTNLCKNCLNCVNFVSNGCLLAKSLDSSERSSNKMGEAQGFGRYLTFGMRSEWLKSFFANPEEWFTRNTLGNRQYPAMINWLIDSELLIHQRKEKIISPLTNILKKHSIFISTLSWQIIWINLFYNSPVVRWYLNKIPWYTSHTSKSLTKLVMKDFEISFKTAYGGIISLLNTFESSPLGNTLKIGYIEKNGRLRIVKKMGTDDIHPIAILYSLYRYAIFKKRYKFTVSELYKDTNKDGSPYLLFGISREALENNLRWLNNKYRDLIHVDIIADLDNISLSEEIKDYVALLNDIMGREN